MKYQRFEAEDVAEILRHEDEARQAKVMAEQAALSSELVGPYKMTWDFWQVLFERRDVKPLSDFEAGGEFQTALQHSVRALETSPLWANRPERDTMLAQYRNKLVLHAKGDQEPDADVQQGSESLDAQDGQGSDAEHHADHDATLAALFDPVAVPQLEAMFPASGKWASYAERAASNKLKGARVARGVFNPYLAALWWLGTGPVGWDRSKCMRKLANNLPARSLDSKYMLTGDFE
jgi:hypothetical protein